MSVLTGTQVLLLVVSETGLVYTFTTPKLQPLVTKAEGKNLIQVSNNLFIVAILRPLDVWTDIRVDGARDVRCAQVRSAEANNSSYDRPA